MDRRRLKRQAIKGLLSPLLRWRPLRAPKPGFTIIVGTPWQLRHLLPVNLHFIATTDLREVQKVQVIFDRTRQPGADEVIAAAKAKFPQLPLEFQFHPPLSGRIVRAANQSKFFASMNWVLGLKACETRYAVLHDFDLYPVRADYFAEIVRVMRERTLYFSGTEHTFFDGLTPGDALIGTWALGIDVQWLREHYRPIDCFHAFAPVNGRVVDLDAFSRIQSLTPERGLASGIGREAFAHVGNLCSTFLRFTKGEKVAVAWRLHYLWYLQSVGEDPPRLDPVIDAMRSATSPTLTVGGYSADFADVHVTCSNVLRDDLERMERALFGGCREKVRQYIDGFADFLARVGDNRPIDPQRAGSTAPDVQQSAST